MIILGLDQSTDVTGWAYRLPSDTIMYGAIKTPSPTKRGGVSEARWQRLAIERLIREVNPDVLVLEGLHLGQTKRGKNKSVDTLINLAQFRGRLLDLADSLELPVMTVTSPELASHLNVSAFANRETRKARSSFCATVLIYGNAFAVTEADKWIPHDQSDAINILMIAEARWRLEHMVEDAGNHNVP